VKQARNNRNTEMTMSEFKRILALVSDGARSDVVLALAARMAKTYAARLDALHAVEPLASGAFLSPEAASVAVQWMRQTEDERRTAAQARVQRAAQAAGFDIKLSYVDTGAVEQALQHACSADLIVLSQRDPSSSDGTSGAFAERLLIATATPLLFVPYVDALPVQSDGAPPLGRRALVAWTPKCESVRALRDALPLLKRAERVELMRFVRPDAGDDGLLEQVLAHLAAHGVRATATVRHAAQPSLGERLIAVDTVDAPIAEALLSHAADTETDLIVMGGYGHPRAWELAMGGVTRTILRSMTVPVLMSH
jgi:nucleotide-binding universal stress UspA family protein